MKELNIAFKILTKQINNTEQDEDYFSPDEEEEYDDNEDLDHGLIYEY